MRILLNTAILIISFTHSFFSLAEENDTKDPQERATSVNINARYSVNEKIINAFAEPNGASAILWQIEMLSPVIVLEQKDGWVKIKDHEGDLAWIKATQLTKEDTIITKKRANVRSGPGPENEILFYTLKGVPFKVLNSEGNWYQIQHISGKEGWIYKPLVW